MKGAFKREDTVKLSCLDLSKQECIYNNLWFDQEHVLIPSFTKVQNDLLANHPFTYLPIFSRKKMGNFFTLDILKN